MKHVLFFLMFFSTDNTARALNESVPQVQKMVMNELLKNKRTDILDPLAKKMLTLAGPDFVARFLYGCR